MTIGKKMLSGIPLALLLAQQLYLCLWFCNIFHADSDNSSQISHLWVVPDVREASEALPDDCAKSRHITECEREQVQRVAGIDHFTVPEAIPPEGFFVCGFPPVIVPPPTQSAPREKTFLKLRNLRC